MPELPEVETTLRGITPYIKNQKIEEVTLRHTQLRWPVNPLIQTALQGHVISTLSRRGKYLLLTSASGTLILHLGMSGSLRIVADNIAPQKHDHVDIAFQNKKILRLTDPRRFGAVLWTTDDPYEHTLLKNLGPEPLSRQFTEQYLWKRAQGRKMPVKSFIMDSSIVVGVGNIYATEALFAAGIHPETPAGKISRTRYKKCVDAIKKILRAAIKQGGTTLKDFLNSDGKPGYFKFHLKAYGRKGLPCLQCKTTLKEIRLGQRSSVYCPRCQ